MQQFQTVAWSAMKECNKIQKVTQISKVSLTKRKNYRKVKKWLLGEEILDNDKIYIYIYIYQTHENE